jgi:hypothetical protein
MEPHGTRVEVRHSGNPPFLNCMTWLYLHTAPNFAQIGGKIMKVEQKLIHSMDFRPFYDKGPYRFLRAGTRAAREKKNSKWYT